MPNGFIGDFVGTLLHSGWQSALLLGAAAIICTAPQRHPLSKRNVLLVALLLQFGLSAITFLLLRNSANLSFSLPVIDADIPADFSVVLFSGWLLTAFAKTGVIALRWINFKKTVSRSLTRPLADLKIFCSTHAHRLGIKKNVSLWFSDFVTTPLTYGFWKPVIVLPVSLINRLSMQDAEALILHELEHIRSRDFILNFIAVSAEVIYCFNPFTYGLIKMIRKTREQNCDMRVIDFQYSSLAYASALLEAARLKKHPVDLAVAAVSNKNHLLKRIAYFSEARTYRNSRIAPVVLFSAVAMLTLFTTRYFTGTELSPVASFPAARPLPAVPSREIARTVSTIAVHQSAKPGRRPVKAKHEFFAEDFIISTPAASAQPIYVGYEAPEPVQEIIYKLETPQGQITQTFRLKIENGEWLFEPVLMLIEGNADSIPLRGDPQ